VTTIRSAAVALPAFVGRLTFRYTFSHGSDASAEDYLRTYVEDGNGVRTLVQEELGGATTDLPAWASASVPMSAWAGQTVRIVFAAADLGSPSTIEAAVDDVRIIRPLGVATLASSSR
jgi:aminopeptidase S